MSEVKPALIGVEEPDNAAPTATGPSTASLPPELIDEYLKHGQATRDRTVMVAKVSFWLTGVVVLMILVIKFLPEFMDTAFLIGEEMDKEKSHPGVILLSEFMVIILVAFPLPGRATFNLILGFVYQWWALPMIYFGQITGGTMAFVGARYCWPYLETRNVMQTCCCCCLSRDGKPRKTVLFLLASLAAVEQKPFQSVFLLVLTPIPVTALSYILGAKCLSIRLVTYVSAVAAGSIKVALPVYLGTSCRDLAKLFEGGADTDPIDIIVTILSVLIAIGVFVETTRRAYLQLRQAQERLKEVANASLEAQAAARSHSDKNEDGSATSADALCLELANEYSKAKRGLAFGVEAPIEEEQETPQICIAVCACICFALGVTTFVIALLTLVRLTPLMEDMSMVMGARTMCPELEIRLPWMEIPSVNISSPVTFTNPNPLRLSGDVQGDLLEPIGGAIIGHVVPLRFAVDSRKRSLFDAGSPAEIVFHADAVLRNVSSIRIPQKIDLTPYLHSANNGAGGSALCPLPDRESVNFNVTWEEYVQCMEAVCEDSDLKGLTGQNVDCALAINFLGCDGDAGKFQKGIAKDTFVKMLCAKSCDNCDRRLASDAPSPLRRLVVDTSLVLELRMSGVAEVEVLGNLKVQREFARTRYIRRNLRILLEETITKRIESMMGSSPGYEGCLVDAEDHGSYCSNDKAAILGESITVGGAVTNCGSIALQSEEETEKVETRKLVLTIIVWLLACCCAGGSCYCCAWQGRVAWRVRRGGKGEAHEVAAHVLEEQGSPPPPDPKQQENAQFSDILGDEDQKGKNIISM